MARISYLLHQELVIPTIHEYLTDKVGIPYQITTLIEDKEYQVKVCEDKSSINAKKAAGILTVFFAKGHTSFLIQGNPKYGTLLEKCREYIIQTTELGVIQKENKCAVFHDIEKESFNEFIALLSTEDSIQVSHRAGCGSVDEYISVQGRYETTVVITYFKNKTVTIQGLVTTILIEIYNLSVQLFGAEDYSSEGGFLAAIKAPGVEIISESLDYHFQDRSKFVDTRLEDLILSSIKMLNSNITLPDYSLMSSGALRALEGLIGMRLHADIAFEDKESIGGRFTENSTTKVWTINRTNITSTPLINALQDSYKYYRDKRHSSFHTQFRNPMATIIYPDKNQALGVVEECIRLLNRIINNW